MNPAILAILWIRLSVIFGYPVPLAGPYNPLWVPGKASEFEYGENVTEAANLNRLTHETAASFFDTTETSPYFTYETMQPTSIAADPNQTQIISVVRVSSSFVAVQPKRWETVTKSVGSNTSRIYNSFTGRNIASGSLHGNVVTPFVSLLRDNRFDVDKDDAKETFKASFSSTVPLSKTPFQKSRYFDNYSVITNTRYCRYNTFNETAQIDATSTAKNTDTAAITETYPTSKKQKNDERSESYDEHQDNTERVYEEPEKVYGEPERVYGEPEKMYEEPETVRSNTELDKFKVKPVEEPRRFGLSGSSENSNPYSFFRTRTNDKKSSFIVDNGTHRKYRVEKKTPDGFIVGEYGMVSHRDGSLRGVRYTADGNISRGTISRLLMHFLSLK